MQKKKKKKNWTLTDAQSPSELQNLAEDFMHN